MGKKHKHPEHENLERWLVSYADFITLLFATFVVLYALSYADLQKLRKVSESIRQAFNPGHALMKEPGGVMKGTPENKILPKSGNSILDKVMPHPQDTANKGGHGDGEGQGGPNTGSGGSLHSITQAAQQINAQVKAMKLGAPGEANNGVKVKLQERGIVISFAGSLLFAPGSAGLKPDAFPLLDKVAATLKDANRVIHVEGHTDGQAFISAVYPSNWELSCARASSVVRYFVSHGQIPANHLAAVGYADTRPVADNSTADGRSKNRRVDIIILFTNAVTDADAGAAQKTEKVVVSEEGSGMGDNNTHKVPANGEKPQTPPAEKPKPVDVHPERINILKPIH